MSKEEKIKELVKNGKYEFSRHAEREREADEIPIEELETALMGCEMIEDYPDDPRGASFLVLGYFNDRPIHAVCAIRNEPEELLFITVYDPSKHSYEWTDDYRRRKE